MSFRIPVEKRRADTFHAGHHVLVDASGAGAGRYVMAAVVLKDGVVERIWSQPSEALSSVEAELECIRRALRAYPQAWVWNDCTPAIERMLAMDTSVSGRLFWPSPRMRKPFHDLVHWVSTRARDLSTPQSWELVHGEPWDVQPKPGPAGS